MSLISSVESAGEKLFSQAHAAPTAPVATPSPADVNTLNTNFGAAGTKYIAAQKLSVENWGLKYDCVTRTVPVTDLAPDQATEDHAIGSE